MVNRLKDKVALVFGGGSAGEGWGNGKAAAVAYAREGAKVMVVDLNAEAAEQTSQIILSENGISSYTTANVTNSVDVQKVVSDTIKEFGQIDILHNNVGLPQMGSVTDISEENWQKAMDVNLKSVYLAMKYVIPHMKERKKGAIVNISSLAGIRYIGYPYPAYSASKAAVNHLTSSVALEYASYGIRVNAIMPGLINTPLIYNSISGQYDNVDEMVTARDASVPTGRMGTAWDIANAAVFLASDEASFITGVCLPVDGGQSIRC
ncbi:SDR family oxidoreductase [Psychrobacillus sp. NEAU-3TGS]|uniref:SDR family NAD(P)-dependent oxidoreductase n=1 Tax=Psychrobacillus sp. NEAU-3TGS TaxID=2995412 RepID=UPI002497A64F|nr:SDR family oxidoreductase [Psychrobacillus sp. NEAU-3TGS]MDI2589749.1 SDR family oxidoreductase [Psychrobacillus sp. NEAU-3TGS]